MNQDFRQQDDPMSSLDAESREVELADRQDYRREIMD